MAQRGTHYIHIYKQLTDNKPFISIIDFYANITYKTISIEIF